MAFGTLVDLFFQFTLGFLQLRQDFQRTAVGRAFRHHHVDYDFIRLHLRHEGFFDPAGTEQADSHHQRGDENTGCQVALVDRELTDLTIPFVCEMNNAVRDAFLKMPKPTQHCVITGF